MLTLALLASLALAPQAQLNAPVPPAPAVRTERLTPDEVKQIAEATEKIEQAKRELQGLEDGIAQHHGALTDCGCYVNRQPDTYQIKGEEIIITTNPPKALGAGPAGNQPDSRP